MISTELVQRCPFFSHLADAQRRAIAAISEQVSFEKDMTIFEEGQNAESLYILLQGTVDLYLMGKDPNKPLWVGEINPDEPFGISALVTPHIYTMSARVALSTQALKINGPALCALCEMDYRLGYHVACEIASAAMERVHLAHVQLAAHQE